MGKEFKENFDYGSVLPTVVFVVGLLSIYFFLTDQFSEGFLTMLAAFLVYVIDNLLERSDKRSPSQFNSFLDNMAVFVAFGLSAITFAAVFYKDEQSFLVLILIYFFAITTLLSLARNWTLDTKNTRGWPIAFNGIFLPLLFYIFKFYIQSPGTSIFFFYFAVVGILSSTNYNFLGIEDSSRKSKKKDSSTFDSDEEYDGYISLNDEEKPSGIKLAAAFYKKKDNVHTDEKSKSKKGEEKLPDKIIEDGEVLDDDEYTDDYSDQKVIESALETAKQEEDDWDIQIDDEEFDEEREQIKEDIKEKEKTEEKDKKNTTKKDEKKDDVKDKGDKEEEAKPPKRPGFFKALLGISSNDSKSEKREEKEKKDDKKDKEKKSEDKEEKKDEKQSKDQKEEDKKDPKDKEEKIEEPKKEEEKKEEQKIEEPVDPKAQLQEEKEQAEKERLFKVRLKKVFDFKSMLGLDKKEKGNKEEQQEGQVGDAKSEAKEIINANSPETEQNEHPKS